MTTTANPLCPLRAFASAHGYGSNAAHAPESLPGRANFSRHARAL